MKEARRGEQNAEVNAEICLRMLRGVRGGNWDSGAAAGASYQASTYLDHEERATLHVAEAATRAVFVSSDFLKSGTLDVSRQLT
jgi:hypothetical protein